MASAKEIIEKARQESRTVLTEMESKELLRSLGIDPKRAVYALSRMAEYATFLNERWARLGGPARLLRAAGQRTVETY